MGGAVPTSNQDSTMSNQAATLFQVTVYTSHARPMCFRFATLDDAVKSADMWGDDTHCAEVTDLRDGTWNDSVRAYYSRGATSFRACYA